MGRDRILRLLGQRQAIVAGSLSVEPLFPELIQPAAGMDAAQSQDIFRTGFAPEHARLLAAGADEGLAAGLDDPRADEEALTAKGPILHSFHIVDEVSQFVLDRLSLRPAGTFLAGFFNEVFDAVAEQPPHPAAAPGL